MRWQGKLLSKAKKIAIANYLGIPDVPVAAVMTGYCARDLDPPPNPPGWSGWGSGPGNSRFQPFLAAAGVDVDHAANNGGTGAIEGAAVAADAVGEGRPISPLRSLPQNAIECPHRKHCAKLYRQRTFYKLSRQSILHVG
jgi:hypothetical protein